MLKKFNTNLTFRLVIHFFVGWPVVAIMGRYMHDLAWGTALIAGAVLTGVVLLVSMFVIIRERKKNIK